MAHIQSLDRRGRAAVVRKKGKSDVSLASIIGWFRTTWMTLFLLSGVINLLALTGAFYMLQIYDRALTSQSIDTLIVISALAIGLYLFQGILDITRSQILVRIGARADLRLAPLAHRVAIDMPRFGYSPAEANERGRDVDVLRHFISGQGPIALLDLPWMPIYLAFVYLLHPWLAVLVAGGALVLGTLTLVTELLTKRLIMATQKAAISRATHFDTNVHNAEVVRAMGIRGRAIERFDDANQVHLALQMKASDIGGTFSGLSKVLRMMLQSAVLGLGAYFVIRGEMSAGAIIAASIISARALAPIDMAISQWKAMGTTRRSYRRLGETLAAIDDMEPRVQLPAPHASVKVEKITVAAPGSGTVVLSDVSFELEGGQALGLIGPSGSGKSSLARALTGIWPLVRGSVRFDDADISQWNPDELGPHIGYLPQEVSLLNGSIAENICRFDPQADGGEIIAAARGAGVHEMILRLPNGFETEAGVNGAALSAGQRQRVALARAIYGTPFLVVLDEPNSNLDAEGEAALTEAILGLRAKGSIIIVIAHRPSALNAVDMIGIMQAGKLVAFGAKDDILARHLQPVPRMTPPGTGSVANGDTRWAQSRT